jgi:hypothetical protein
VRGRNKHLGAKLTETEAEKLAALSRTLIEKYRRPLTSIRTLSVMALFGTTLSPAVIPGAPQSGATRDPRDPSTTRRNGIGPGSHCARPE